MLTVAHPVYSLPTNPAVKWLATQERNLSKELPYTDSATETPEEYVSRTYLQFLWLPQKYHTRISQVLTEENDPVDAEEEYVWYTYPKDKTSDVDIPEGQDEDEAHERLKHAWLERMERREVQIQILLHFLLLTLSGPGAHSAAAVAPPDPTASLPLPPPLSPSKSKKRKRRVREKPQAPQLPQQTLEERLESYMDKLAMWQLMRSVDSTLRHGHGHAPSAKSAANGLDGATAKDERDWMQAFYEDVVEPLFKDKLPDFCALFRSKLFQDAGNSDADTVDLSPPASPKQASKRLKSASSTASGSAAAGSSKSKDDRSRSRSLSVSLEQEQRERSRSVSIAPGGLRRRAIVREVSMTTVFKGKDRTKSKNDLSRTASNLGPGPSLSRTQSQNRQTGPPEKEKNTQGTVLVSATPTKARIAPQPVKTQTRLPALFGGSSSQSQTQPQSRLTRVDSLDINMDADEDAFATPTKARPLVPTRPIARDTADEDAGDEWTLSSSPDVLLLGAPGPQAWDTPGATTPPASSSPGELGGFGRSAVGRSGDAGRSQGRILVGDTPTKAR